MCTPSQTSLRPVREVLTMANLYSQDSGEEVDVSPRSRADSAGGVPERRDVYERLADELRQGIVSGRYKPGDRLPSTLELMERTGVANLRSEEHTSELQS